MTDSEGCVAGKCRTQMQDSEAGEISLALGKFIYLLFIYLGTQRTES